jgi:hypothetical protein
MENKRKRSTKAYMKLKMRNTFNGMVSHGPTGGQNHNMEILHTYLEYFAA